MDVTDLVCGTQIDIDRSAATIEHGGWVYFFCSPECHRLFAAHPARYSEPKSRAAQQRRPSGACHE